MIQKLLDKYNYFVEFCFEHGGALRAHSKFANMQNELRQEIEKLSLFKMTWECPNCGHLIETSFWDFEVIYTGSRFKCDKCGVIIQVELTTRSGDEELDGLRITKNTDIVDNGDMFNAPSYGVDLGSSDGDETVVVAVEYDGEKFQVTQLLDEDIFDSPLDMESE